MRTTLGRHSAILLSICLLTACGGGGSGSAVNSNVPPPPPPPAPNQDAGGIWQTQYTETSGPTAGDAIKAYAIVDESGSFYFALQDQNNGCAEVGFGQATVVGNSISGNIDVAVATFSTTPGVNTTCAFPDGSTSGTGIISGTVAQGSSMTLTDSVTTSNGTSLGTETHTWVFNSLYDNPSSLSAVSANYTDGSDTLSIAGNGVIFEQDPTTGCVINGQISIINAAYNAYSMSLTYSNCTGSAAGANGYTLTGLATLDTTVSPAQLDFGVSTSTSGGGFVVLVDSLPQ